MFEYLRLLCLEHQLPRLNGVLTNYQDWIFVSYSLQDEVNYVYESQVARKDIRWLSFDVCDKIRLRDE
jgi:hypothetical protein